MKIHQLEGYIQNIFLVEYPEKLLLLDGCSRADVSILKRFITEQLGRPFEQLKLVMVTHMHPDHAGGASYLQKHYSVELATGDVAGEWYQGFRGRVMHLVDLGLAYYVGQRYQRERFNLWYSPLLSTKYRLQDGEQVPGFSDWQVLLTPGHTDRDLSLYHPDSQTLYVADTILRVKQKLICPFPISQPTAYRSSIERYRRLAVSNYLLAHGEGGQISSDELVSLQQLCPSKPTRYTQFLADLLRKKFA